MLADDVAAGGAEDVADEEDIHSGMLALLAGIPLDSGGGVRAAKGERAGRW